MEGEQNSLEQIFGSKFSPKNVPRLHESQISMGFMFMVVDETYVMDGFSTLHFLVYITV